MGSTLPQDSARDSGQDRTTSGPVRLDPKRVDPVGIDPLGVNPVGTGPVGLDPVGPKGPEFPESEAGTENAPLTPPIECAEGTPLYVHLPFCAAKCGYCDFFSVPAEGQNIEGMVAAILDEARERAPRKPRTVFLGGGTPSLLSAELMTSLLDELHRMTSFRDSALEVTAECNPESLDQDKARCLLDGGVKRLSIGLQSLRAETLSLFGRVHSADQGLAAVAAARAAGVDNLNVDMIYAAPDQSAEQWAADLDRVLALKPEHLAAYNLTYEEGTPFARSLSAGELQRRPEEVELRMFHDTRRIAAAHGLEAYEISNFARHGRECAHNLNYWANGDYIGVGPSAVSKVGAARFGNLRGTSAYTRRIAEGRGATLWLERLEAPARLGETWWLSLRLTRGVVPSRARAMAGFDSSARSESNSAPDSAEDHDPAVRTARRLRAEGLVEECGGAWRLTARGLPLADAVAAEFLVPDSE